MIPLFRVDLHRILNCFILVLFQFEAWQKEASPEKHRWSPSVHANLSSPKLARSPLASRKQTYSPASERKHTAHVEALSQGELPPLKTFSTWSDEAARRESPNRVLADVTSLLPPARKNSNTDSTSKQVDSDQPQSVASTGSPIHST